MIYLDNSATTYPKPKSVIYALTRGQQRLGFNSGRGGYKESVAAADMIFKAREVIADLLGFEPQNIAFTPNCTYALNMAIKGTLSHGDHVIISNLEHNAVARPVHALYEKGIITYDDAQYSYDDEITARNFEKLIKPNTKAIVCMHASNVFGCVLPISKIGEIAHRHGLIFIVDAAQSAGVLDINAKRDNIDILCAPGHKGLYGPMGSGFIALSQNVKLDTVIEGGTGSRSMDLNQPDFMPDRLESGTLNNAGICALGEGARFVKSRGTANIYNHERELCSFIYDSFEKNSDFTLYTPPFDEVNLAPIISFNYKDYPSEKTAQLLAAGNIAVRAGFHCSPLAHRAFKTDNRGTVRLSPSVFTSYKECEAFFNYIKKL